NSAGAPLLDTSDDEFDRIINVSQSCASWFPDKKMSAQPVRPRAPGTCREASLGRSSARAAHSPVCPVLGPLQKIDGTARIEFVDFHVAADLNAPAETLFENAVAKPMHFGDVAKEHAVTIGGNELDHVRLLAGLVLRDWRRSLARPTSCAVAQGSGTGTY